MISYVTRGRFDGVLWSLLVKRMAYKYLSKEVLIGFDKYQVMQCISNDNASRLCYGKNVLTAQ